MRKRVTAAPAAPAPATFAPDAPCPAGYAILPIGGGWQPVREQRPGVYVELMDERTRQRGPYRTRAEALTVIAANPDWRKRQAEIARGQAQAQTPAVSRKGGKR